MRVEADRDHRRRDPAREAHQRVRVRQRDAGLLGDLAHARGAVRGGALAVVGVDGAAGEHPGAAHEPLRRVALDQQHLEPLGAAAEEDHRRRLPRLGRLPRRVELGARLRAGLRQLSPRRGEKSAFLAPHTGQNQSVGMSSNAVPAGMPPSGIPLGRVVDESAGLADPLLSGLGGHATEGRRSAPPYSTSHARPDPDPRAARVRGRHVDARRRDRGRAADGPVLRRLDDRVGEHDRDRARRAVRRLLVRRPPRRPPPAPARAVPARARRLAAARAGADRRPPVPDAERRRVRLGLDRHVRRLAVRRPRARGRAGADARRRLAVGDPPQAARGRGLRRDRGAHVRDLHRRLAGRDVPRRAAADPAGRHAAHVPGLRAGARARRGARPRRALAAGPGARRRAARDPARDDQGLQRRARDLRDRDGVPVRARRAVPGRRAAAGAQRGPGGALDLQARHGADRQLLGRAARRSVRRADRPAAPRRDAGHRGRDDRARLRALPAGHAGRRRRDRRRAAGHRPALLRPRAAPAAAHDHARTRARSCARRPTATT